HGVGIVLTRLRAHVLDLGRLGIRPTRTPRPAASPNGGALGTSNAFMSVTADVVPVSTTKALGTLFSSFTPSELIDYYLNGSLAGTFAADGNGHLGVYLNTGSGGYITIEGVG